MSLPSKTVTVPRLAGILLGRGSRTGENGPLLNNDHRSVGVDWTPGSWRRATASISPSAMVVVLRAKVRISTDRCACG